MASEFFRRIFPIKHFIDRLTLIRPFRSTDIPQLARLWRQCATSHHISPVMTESLLCELVVSKQFFEADGCLIAEKDNQVVGCAVIGFAADSAGDKLDSDSAVLSRIMVGDPVGQRDAMVQLLSGANYFARQCGAKSLYYGSKFPDSPFLGGAYGGYYVSGLLEHESEIYRVLEDDGFEITDQVHVWRRSLTGYRASLDRQVRRASQQIDFKTIDELPSLTWYDTVSAHPFLHDRFLVEFHCVQRRTQQIVGRMLVANVQPLGGMAEPEIAGVVRFDVADSDDARIMSAVMLNFTLLELKKLGFANFEAQVLATDTKTTAIYEDIGCEISSRGLQMRKSLVA